MARKESVALGGYFPTPTHLIPRIAPLLEKHMGDEEVTFADPCAGEGTAILGLIKQWVKPQRAKLFACEMEGTRSATLRQACQEVGYHLTTNLLHGDAFHTTFKRGSRDGVSVLFLNPPYDQDREYRRLEHKFLTRFTPMLMSGGALIFVVPFYALKASAELLATEYMNVRCFKFPDADFESFKQVVLFAQKALTRHLPDPEILAQVESYAQDASQLPELPNIMSAPLARIEASRSYHEGLEEWVLRPADLSSLMAKARPWVQSTKAGVYTPVRGVLPDLPVHELMLRKYPVATPPRPAHIAAGIAAGIFNGARVEPTDYRLDLPPLLVKGVFDQEYRTIEEKDSKDGDATILVQVQQPKLVATVLDLRTHKYHTLGNSGTCDPSIDGMTVGGLLRYYGDSLMAVMEQQCPILYDPRRDGESISLAPTDRTPFTAQAHAAKALVKLLGGPDLPLRKRQGKAAFLLGEIGSGKSTVSLVVSKTVGAKRPLIICPPHLLTSWANEVAAVLPEAEVRILDSVGELEALAQDTRAQTIVAVLSRETAKLSHGWERIGDTCPKCGNPTPHGDLAKLRSRCEARTLRNPSSDVAKVVLKLCRQLMQFAPQDPTIQSLMRSRWAKKQASFLATKRETKPLAFPGFVPSYFDAALAELLPRFSEGERVRQAIVWILLCTASEERISATAEHFLSQPGYYEKDFGRELLLLLPPSGERQVEAVSRYKSSSTSYHYSPWGGFEKNVEDAQKGEAYIRVAGLPLSWAKGILTLDENAPARSLKAATQALNALSHLAGLKWSKPCGEFLFQAVPEPRRVALAQHIVKQFPKTFDFLIVDEAHEYSTEGSAQERAAHRLMGLGIPTIEMTGSVMNGYAESLFMNMWAVSPGFRQEFKREDKARFNDRYGYRKRVVIQKAVDPGKVIEFGTMSDRVTSTARVIGNAPGVLPLFLLRHLLPISVTLHKADLALDLPPCKQEKHLIDPGPELAARFQHLRDTLVARIRKDMFVEGMAGKLFGQLAELPSYVDRATADTGNTPTGDFEIRYPESVGSLLVATQPPLPASTVLPKEQWLIDQVKRELAEGRNVMVFSWHVSLLPRLARLISEALDGEKVPILYANKVPTAKRQDWITKQVVQKGARVMVTNPVAIQTGLNNLVHFATEIWMENPACNPIIFRQAIGRVDRIGQLVETRILFPIYTGTLQPQLYDLLLQKVAVSISTDGLDPESALLAAGVGTDEFLTGLSIGKQLWAMLSEGVLPTTSEPVYRMTPKKPISVFDLINSVG